MKWLEHQRIRYLLSHHPIPFEIWERVLRDYALFQGLSAVERAQLRKLATLFLQYKQLNGVQGLTLSTEMAVTVAAQACLPILNLGLDYYDGWVEVVLYPAAFRVSREHVDESGLVSEEEEALSGESWLQGPVILAWSESMDDLARPRSGRNVVIHELAHKLDMLNGSANGMPPLHPEMVRLHWSEVFNNAFDSLNHCLLQHQPPPIDPYAATEPAEFFAVTSEYFFTDPQTLRHHYPAVYEQLALFYRQDPCRRYICMPELHSQGSHQPTEQHSR